MDISATSSETGAQTRSVVYTMKFAGADPGARFLTTEQKNKHIHVTWRDTLVSYMSSCHTHHSSSWRPHTEETRTQRVLDNKAGGPSSKWAQGPSVHVFDGQRTAKRCRQTEGTWWEVCSGMFRSAHFQCNVRRHGGRKSKGQDMHGCILRTKWYRLLQINGIVFASDWCILIYIRPPTSEAECKVYMPRCKEAAWHKTSLSMVIRPIHHTQILSQRCDNWT